MATITRFEDLEIWQIARELSKEIYQITITSKFEKDFRFKDQIKAAAGSVMDNIAEGFERGSQLEFINFLSYSRGFTGEVRSQLARALDFEYISTETFNELKNKYELLASKIGNFIKYLNQTQHKGQKFKDRENKN